MTLSIIGDIASIISLISLLFAVIFKIRKYMKSKIRELAELKEYSEKWFERYLNLATNPTKRSEISLYLIIYHQTMKSNEWQWILQRTITIFGIFFAIIFYIPIYLKYGFSLDIMVILYSLSFIGILIGTYTIWYNSSEYFKISNGFEKGILTTLEDKFSIYFCENCSEECSKRKS
jgi:hypothetical protein